MTFWNSTSFSDSCQPILLFTNIMTLIPSLNSTELRVVSIEHLQRLWHANRERLPFRTPGSVPFLGYAYAPHVATSFWNLPCRLHTFNLDYPSVLSRRFRPRGFPLDFTQSRHIPSPLCPSNVGNNFISKVMRISLSVYNFCNRCVFLY